MTEIKLINWEFPPGEIDQLELSWPLVNLGMLKSWRQCEMHGQALLVALGKPISLVMDHFQKISNSPWTLGLNRMK